MSRKTNVEFPPMMTTLSSSPPTPKLGTKLPKPALPKVGKAAVVGPPKPKKESVLWTLGVPTAADVARHERLHPFKAREGTQGAIWLCIDREAAMGPYPQLLHLRVGLIGETMFLPSNISAGRHKGCVEDVAGKILLQNGISFWQLLDECLWAHRAEYTPVTVEGIPISWV